MKKLFRTLTTFSVMAAMLSLVACREDEPVNNLIPADDIFGTANEVFSADEW